MSNQTSFELALKILKEDSRVEYIVQGPVIIRNCWEENEQVLDVEFTNNKIDLTIMLNDQWNIVYSENQETN